MCEYAFEILLVLVVIVKAMGIWEGYQSESLPITFLIPIFFSRPCFSYPHLLSACPQEAWMWRCQAASAPGTSTTILSWPQLPLGVFSSCSNLYPLTLDSSTPGGSSGPLSWEEGGRFHIHPRPSASPLHPKLGSHGLLPILCRFLFC